MRASQHCDITHSDIAGGDLEMSASGQVIGWLARHKRRIGFVMVGHTVSRIEILLFDHLLYGSVIAYATTTWGPVWGSLAGLAIMLPLSAGMCYAFVLFYDWTKRDWLGIEALKQFRDRVTPGSRIRQLVMHIARRSDAAAFIILSLYGDPFVVTMYLRRGVEQYDGLLAREWIIFWSSLVLSNAYWTLRWTVIVEVVRFIWALFW